MFDTHMSHSTILSTKPLLFSNFDKYFSYSQLYVKTLQNDVNIDKRLKN